MKKIICSISICLCFTVCLKASDIILSKTGNTQLDGIYKSFIDVSGAMSFIKNTDGVTFRIARFKIELNQKGDAHVGWLISDSNGKEYFAIKSDNVQPPADGWDVARAGVGFNVDFDLTFSNESLDKPLAFSFTNANSTIVKIYPNPTLGIINVESDSPIQRLSLVNLAGQMILTDKNNRLDLSNIQTGTYSLIIETENGKTIKRIVKQ
jgi:Secretion system C-terminal sorting domain